MRTGRCPKRLQVLLAGYTFEASLRNEKKLVNVIGMQSATANEEDPDALERPEGTEGSSFDTSCDSLITYAKPKRNHHWWMSSTMPSRTSADANEAHTRTSPDVGARRPLGTGPSPGLVAEFGDESLFPAGASWEDEAQEREVEPREKRTFLAPRGLFANHQQGSKRSSTGSATGMRASAVRMPRFKRCSQQCRSGAATSESDLTSDAGGETASEVDSIAPSDVGSVSSCVRSSSVKRQLGWLMRSESEAALNETRPPGHTSSPTLSSAAPESEEAPATDQPSAVLQSDAIVSSTSDQDYDVRSPLSEQEGSFVSFDTGAGALEPGRRHGNHQTDVSGAASHDAAYLQDAASQDGTLPWEEGSQLDAVPEDAPMAEPSELRQLRRDSAILENPQAVELRDASVRDIKLYIQRRERMLRV